MNFISLPLLPIKSYFKRRSVPFILKLVVVLVNKAHFYDQQDKPVSNRILLHGTSRNDLYSFRLLQSSTSIIVLIFFYFSFLIPNGIKFKATNTLKKRKHGN